MKNVDVSKRSNIKCEHCEHYGQPKGNLYDDCFCKISGEKKNYWNRCKQFEWKRSILTLNALPALGCKGFSPCGEKIMGKREKILEVIEQIKKENPDSFTASQFQTRSGSTAFEVWDYTDESIEREYTLIAPEDITVDFIRDKIKEGPSVKNAPLRVDLDALARWIYEAVDHELLMSFLFIFMVYEQEEDFAWLSAQGEKFLEISEVVEGIDDDLLGLASYEFSTVFVNLGAIYNTQRELDAEDEAVGIPLDNDGMNRAVCSTVAHELRHVGQDNIVISQLVTFSGTPEEDAEEYGNRAYNARGKFVLR